MISEEPKKSDQIGSLTEEFAQSGFFTVLATSFSTVFIAELGDKTQIATLLLSVQSGKPLIVFIGAALALICSSLAGVMIGQWISKNLPPDQFKYMAGVLMVGLGLWLGIQATNSLLKNIAIYNQ